MTEQLPLQLIHYTSIQYTKREGNEAYQASCSCGWVGKEHHKYDDGYHYTDCQNEALAHRIGGAHG